MNIAYAAAGFDFTFGILLSYFGFKQSMWFEIKNNKAALHIFAKPNAKRSAFIKISEDELHIALHAKPHEGEANKELISYFAKLFRLPKSQVILERGESSRHKVVIVPLTATIQNFIEARS